MLLQMSTEIQKCRVRKKSLLLMSCSGLKLKGNATILELNKWKLNLTLFFFLLQTQETSLKDLNLLLLDPPALFAPHLDSSQTFLSLSTASCEIMSGKTVQVLVSRGNFFSFVLSKKSQIFLHISQSTCRNWWTGQYSSAATPIDPPPPPTHQNTPLHFSGHLRALQFFPFVSHLSKYSSLTTAGPSLSQL